MSSYGTSFYRHTVMQVEHCVQNTFLYFRVLFQGLWILRRASEMENSISLVRGLVEIVGP